MCACVRLWATDNLYSLHLRWKGGNRAPEGFPSGFPAWKMIVYCSRSFILIPSLAQQGAKRVRISCGCLCNPVWLTDWLKQYTWEAWEFVGLIPSLFGTYPQLVCLWVGRLMIQIIQIWRWDSHVGINNLHVSVSLGPSNRCKPLVFRSAKAFFKVTHKGVAHDVDLSLCICHKGIAQKVILKTTLHCTVLC